MPPGYGRHASVADSLARFLLDPGRRQTAADRSQAMRRSIKRPTARRGGETAHPLLFRPTRCAGIIMLTAGKRPTLSRLVAALVEDSAVVDLTANADRSRA
jgi:hypothetical protein